MNIPQSDCKHLLALRGPLPEALMQCVCVCEREKVESKGERERGRGEKREKREKERGKANPTLVWRWEGPSVCVREGVGHCIPNHSCDRLSLSIHDCIRHSWLPSMERERQRVWGGRGRGIERGRGRGRGRGRQRGIERRSEWMVRKMTPHHPNTCMSRH